MFSREKEPSVSSNSLTYQNFFGEPKPGISVGPYDNEQVHTWTMPDAVNNTNLYIGHTIDSALASMSDFLASEVLPTTTRPPGTTAISLSKSTFQPRYIGQVPEGGVGVLLTDKRKKSKYALQRRQIQFQVLHGLLATEQGRLEYRERIKQVIESLKTTLNFGVIQALFEADDPYREWLKEYGYFNGKDFREHARTDISNWNILRYSAGLAKLHGRNVTEMSKYGGQGDTYIMPREAQNYLSTVQTHNLTYSESGPGGESGKYSHESNSGISRQIGNNGVFLLTTYAINDENVEKNTPDGKVDPLLFHRQVGEYHLAYDTFTGKSYGNYTTSSRTIHVYNEDDDNFSPIDIMTMIDNCGRFDDTTGKVVSFDHRLVSEMADNYSKETKAKDPFHYMTYDGTLRSVEFMGNFQFLTARDVQDWVQTALNLIAGTSGMNSSSVISDLIRVWKNGVNAAKIINNYEFDKFDAWYTKVKDSPMTMYGIPAIPVPANNEKPESTIPLGYASYPGFKAIQSAVISGNFKKYNESLGKQVSEFIDLFETVGNILKKIMPGNPLLDENNVSTALDHPVTATHYQALFENVVTPDARPLFVRSNQIQIAPQSKIGKNIDKSSELYKAKKVDVINLIKRETNIDNNPFFGDITKNVLSSKLALIAFKIKNDSTEDDVIVFINTNAESSNSLSNSELVKHFSKSINWPSSVAREKKKLLLTLNAIDDIFSTSVPSGVEDDMPQVKDANFSEKFKEFNQTQLYASASQVAKFISKKIRNQPNAITALISSEYSPYIPITHSELDIILQLRTKNNLQEVLSAYQKEDVSRISSDSSMFFNMNNVPAVRNIHAAENIPQTSRMNNNIGDELPSSRDNVFSSFASSHSNIGSEYGSQKRRNIHGGGNYTSSKHRRSRMHMMDEELRSISGVVHHENRNIKEHIDNEHFSKLFKDVKIRSSHEIHEALGKVFLFAHVNKDTFTQFADNDLLIPIDFLIFRPHIRYGTYCSIFVKKGLETGQTHLSNSNFTVGDDPTVQIHHAAYSIWTKSVVYNEKNVRIQPNVLIACYNGGRGVTPFKHGRNNYDPLNRIYGSSDYNIDSIFVCAAPRSNGSRYKSPMDITGTFRSSDIPLFGFSSESDEPHYEGYVFDNSRWGWSEGGELGARAFGIVDTTESSYSKPNTIVHQGHTIYNDHIVLSQGHHPSGLTYPGCKPSWSSNGNSELKYHDWTK